MTTPTEKCPKAGTTHLGCGVCYPKLYPFASQTPTEKVEVVDHYDREGRLVKREVNGIEVPIFAHSPTENCSGCTDRFSEGTHQMHTIQHPCPDGDDLNCGYCQAEQEAYERGQKHAFGVDRAAVKAEAKREVVEFIRENIVWATHPEGTKIVLPSSLEMVLEAALNERTGTEITHQKQ